MSTKGANEFAPFFIGSGPAHFGAQGGYGNSECQAGGFVLRQGPVEIWPAITGLQQDAVALPALFPYFQFFVCVGP